MTRLPGVFGGSSLPRSSTIDAVMLGNGRPIEPSRMDIHG